MAITDGKAEQVTQSGLPNRQHLANPLCLAATNFELLDVGVADCREFIN